MDRTTNDFKTVRLKNKNINRIKKKFFYFYIKFYERKIEKILKKNDCKFCFLGHLHIEIKKNNYLVLDTFKNGYFVEAKDFIILSDLHLGKYKYKKEDLEKIKELLEKNKKIILLGDIFDFWYEEKEVIERDYKEIIELIIKKAEEDNLIYIRGNHDWNISKFFNIESKKFFIYKNYLFTHGHLIDPFYRYFPFSLITFIKLLLEDRLRITGKVDKALYKAIKLRRLLNKDLKNIKENIKKVKEIIGLKN